MDSDRKQQDLSDKGAEAYKALVDQRRKDDEERAEEEQAAAQQQHFEVVAQTMRHILDEREGRDAIDRLPENLPPREREALEWLHAAMHAENRQVVGHLAGRERNEELNKALAVLQPVLSSGLIEVDSYKMLYNQVAQKIVGLKKEIRSEIIAETTKFKGPKSEHEEEEDEDDGDEESDDDGDDLEVDDDVEGMKKKKKKGLLRRLFRGGDESEEEKEEDE